MRHRALIVLVLACLVITACDPFALPAAPTATPVPPTPTATEIPLPTDTTEPTNTPVVEDTATPIPLSTSTTSGTPGSNEAELQHEVEQIESDTTKLRGLTPKENVPEHFISQQQLHDNLLKEISDEYTHEEARRDATALWLLRLLKDPSIDLYQLQVDLLTEQVLGYYDQKKNELFVLANQAQLSPLARMTLAHEFTHALQDQYYDLEKVRPDKMENDRGNAVLALIEGDAVASQILYAQQTMSMDELQSIVAESGSLPTQVLDRAPRYITETLLFPYDQGLTFVTHLSQPGKFKGVDAAFKDPPKSTEQIMHPEKYLDSPRDEPVEVALPPLTNTLGTGWKQTDTDTLGEFDLGILLKVNGIAEGDANVAAAGWGGGRYAIYQKGDSALVLMDSRWDTRADATEFGDAMQQSLASLKKDGTLWSDGKRYFALVRSGDRVSFVGGTDRAAVQRALTAVGSRQ